MLTAKIPILALLISNVNRSKIETIDTISKEKTEPELFLIICRHNNHNQQLNYFLFPPLNGVFSIADSLWSHTGKMGFYH